MALSEFEFKRCEQQLNQFLAVHRPPAHVRNQIDINYRIVNQSVEIFEIRPNFHDPLSQMELAVAKATFVKKQKAWKIFWQKSNLTWQRYDPVPEVAFIEDFLEVIGKDEYDCFFS
ncbi:DUF3024 domain-containing protein [Marinomonas primoryensis]|uniref:DUF3024 domain-containing protein n=1 Tax=Marinomonas primoryensis TaxID=178399 RepID=UPI0037037616